MSGRTKVELEEENEELRTVLEDVYDRLGDALGFEDEDEDVSDEDDDETEED